MRVMAYSQNPPHGPHLAAMLEVIHDHLAAGDEVVVLVCHGAHETCWLNPDHRRSRCLACRFGTRTGLRQLTHPRLRIVRLPDQSAQEVTVPHFADIVALKHWTWEGVPHGVGIASSLISEVRDPVPDLGRHRGLVARLVRTSVAFHRTITRACRELRPQRFYVQNGRVCELRAAYLAARQAGMEVCVVADISPGSDRYIIFTGGTPHELAVMKRAIDTTWEESPLPAAERRALAHEVWAAFREHRNPLWAYANKQQSGHLPAGLDPARRVVTIFNSSEDEMVAFDELRIPGHGSQEAAIRHLLALSWPDDVRFVLRIHPNLAGLDNAQTRALAGLADARLLVIAASDAADTYALLDRSHAVITFGSTLGIEAVHWGRPSILLGRAPYEDLPGVVRPADDRALLDAVLRPAIADDRSGADRYGYFLARAGREFVHYRPGKYPGRGTWSGHRLWPPRFFDTLLSVAYRFGL